MKQELLDKYLVPRQTEYDEIKVYDSEFLRSRKHVSNFQGRRTIYLDPETIYRMATLGLSREMIAGYYGLSKTKFNAACEQYPEVEEAFLEGFSAGLVKTAMKLEEKVQAGDTISTIFRMKIGGFMEADKRLKEVQQESQQRVQIYLPNNNRDVLDGEVDDAN